MTTSHGNAASSNNRASTPGRYSSDARSTRRACGVERRAQEADRRRQEAEAQQQRADASRRTPAVPSQQRRQAGRDQGQAVADHVPAGQPRPVRSKTGSIRKPARAYSSR